MSTPADQLRERLARRLGGTWTRDTVHGEDVLDAADGLPVRLVPDDLASTRRDRLWAHLEDLARRGDRLAAVVSVAPLPGRVATLLPLDVWRALLSAAGLTCVLEVPLAVPLQDDRWSTAWHRADPFRLDGVERVGLVLERGPVADPQAGAVIARRLAGPQSQDAVVDVRVGFLVSSHQDFHTLQPWCSRVPPERRCLFVRDAALGRDPSGLEDLLAATAPYGPSVALSDAVRGDLARVGIDVLVSASESTANLAHLGNASTLLLARSLGIATAHAQHGIWPRAEFPPPVRSVADVVLAWSDEYREIIAAPTRVEVVGAPRFDRYADPVHRHVSGLYGSWTRTYARHVVLATNLHWAQHTAAPDAAALVAGLAERFPETLFTLKPHPYEPAPDADALPPNVVVLSQAMMLAASIEPADVVESADLVVTTPSTFALEAAMAGRPFLVMATGNPNRHDHVVEHDVTALEAWLRRPAAADAGSYAARYCDPHRRGRALEVALSALDGLSAAAATVAADAAAVVEHLLASVTRLGRDHHHLLAHAARERDETARYVDSLRWTLDRKDEHIASLHARLDGRSS